MIDDATRGSKQSLNWHLQTLGNFNDRENPAASSSLRHPSTRWRATSTSLTAAQLPREAPPVSSEDLSERSPHFDADQKPAQLSGRATALGRLLRWFRTWPEAFPCVTDADKSTTSSTAIEATTSDDQRFPDASRWLGMCRKLRRAA